MSSNRVDLEYQVAKVLQVEHGGAGNAKGLPPGIGLIATNGSGTSIAVGALVHYIGTTNLRTQNTIEAVASTNATDVLGVCMGLIDADGNVSYQAVADQYDALVLLYGITDVQLSTGVAAGQFAYSTTTAGKATGSSAYAAGALGRFLMAGSGGSTGRILLTGGGTRSLLTMQEIDASPSVSAVTTVLVPNNSLTDNGSGSVSLAYMTPAYGGQETLDVVASSGATLTLGLADGNVHDVTLTANCTISLAGATNGKSSSATIVLRQDGTGGRTVTWPGTVTWLAGVAPTLRTAAGAVDVVIIWSFDGGTSWGATHVVSFPVTEADLSLSDVTTANASTSKHGFLPKLPNDATKFLDGTGAFTRVIGSDHEHIGDIVYSGDGATSAFELPAAPFDAYSVSAYVAGSRTAITLSGYLLTTMTFGSPPASGTDNIIVDIVAAAA